MLTPKETRDMRQHLEKATETKLENQLGYIVCISLVAPALVAAALALNHVKEAKIKGEREMIALLVNLGADPIKARCAVEKITSDNRLLCEKLVTVEETK